MALNQSQEEAVLHKEGPMMVLAGPGSGKTTVITQRTCHLVLEEGIAPSSILVVTFTKAASREMKERFLKKCEITNTRVTFGTFHGVFYGILRQAYGLNGNNILREEEKVQILKEYIYSHNMDIGDEKEFIEGIIGEVSTIKNSQIPIEHYYSTTCPDNVFRKIYEHYIESCKNARKLDFDDMLVYCYELFQKRKDILELWQEKFQYILIDEFQDINKIQYEIIKMLALPQNNLFIVGDDDQSIYRFRGAKPEIMLHFPKDFPDAKQVTLDVNYRSRKSIVEASMRLVEHNKNRFPKKIYAFCQEEVPISILEFPDEKEECYYLLREIDKHIKAQGKYSDIAVLVRTNLKARPVVDKMVEFHVPFQMRDVVPNIYDHWISKNLRAYLHMAAGGRARNEFLQIMNRPNRYISREALGGTVMSFEDLYCFYEEKEWMCKRIEEWEMNLKTIRAMNPFAAITYIRKAIGYDDYLKEYAQYRKMKPEELLEMADEIQQTTKGFDTYEDWEAHIEKYTATLKEKMREKEKEFGTDKDQITISTLHSSKGLEYKKVYILDVNEGVIPYRKAILDRDIEEERRMFYVGMTRAKKELSIFYVKSQLEKKMEKSRFISELEKQAKAEAKSGGKKDE